MQQSQPNLHKPASARGVSGLIRRTPRPGPHPIDAETTWRPGIDPDRRAEPTNGFSRYVWFGGRRRSVLGDPEGTFVDQHGPLLMMGLLTVVMLNVLDALFTIYFLSYGGQEVNPVMNWVLGYGVWPFLLAKTVAIGAGVVVLGWAKNFRAARIGLILVLVGYTALLGWHITLYSWLHW